MKKLSAVQLAKRLTLSRTTFLLVRLIRFNFVIAFNSMEQCEQPRSRRYFHHVHALNSLFAVGWFLDSPGKRCTIGKYQEHVRLTRLYRRRNVPQLRQQLLVTFLQGKDRILVIRCHVRHDFSLS